MSEVSDWATTAAGNAVAYDDIDNRDGIPRVNVKLNFRAIMAAVRRGAGTDIAVPATILIGSTDQAAALEFFTTWGRKTFDIVQFQMSATARDKVGIAGTFTVANLPFTAAGMFPWTMSADQLSGFPTGTVVSLNGNTVIFQAPNVSSVLTPVDGADVGSNWSFRLSGNVPIVI